MAINISLVFLQPMSKASLGEAQCLALEDYYWRNDTCFVSSFGNHAGSIAGLTAIDHFNSRDATYLPAFGNLQACDKRLVASAVYDTGEDPGKGVRAIVSELGAMQACAAGSKMDAVVGPSLSSVSEVTASLTGLEGIAQISMESTSPALDASSRCE